MSDDEDDYLSDKFLAQTAAAPPAAKPKTYSDLRKEAQRKAFIRNEENRRKSRREREVEAREEGLSKSLFERAKEEEETTGSSSGNKAMAMMLKMGFKPGQSLGKPEDAKVPQGDDDAPVQEAASASSKPAHKTEPLPLNEWEGRKGIGTRKRALSPTVVERIAKMAKMQETSGHATFRDRAMQEYAERRAEGRLLSAQRTCGTLDEKNGISFNVLWLNPTSPDSFPAGLMDALQIHSTVALPLLSDNNNASVETRLRQQMQSDALHPLREDADDTEVLNADPEFATDVLEEVAQFVCLQAQDRLELVLSYLRDKYAYCFWCGTQYRSQDEMETECPGIEEDDH